jgi:hypothetical protein
MKTLERSQTLSGKLGSLYPSNANPEVGQRRRLLVS